MSQSVNDKIRIEMDLPSGTYELSKVWNPDVRLSIAPHGDGKTNRLSVGTDIVLRQPDYAVLLAVEEDPAERCGKIPTRIYNKRSGALLSEGYIALGKAQFNKRACTIQAKVLPEDNITCFEGKASTEKNFLSAPNPVTVSGVVGTIFTITGSQFSMPFLPPTIPADITATLLAIAAPGQPGWQEVLIEGENIVPGTPNWTGDFTVTFKREEVTGSLTAPPGLGWVSIAPTHWVRKPRVQEVFDEQTNLVFTGGEYYQHWKIIAESPIDNGRTLKDTLEYLAPCSLPVVSDFFGINPVATAPSNSAYTAAAAAATSVKDIIVFQKSDVLRPSVSNNATIQKVTIADFLTYLKNTGQVDWRIESISGVPTLRIEHFTYFVDGTTPTLDLTASGYSRWIENRDNYTYKSDKSPGTERFYWMDTVSQNFEADNITYGGGCTNPSEVLDYRSAVTTDLARAQAQPEKMANEGFFFIACELFGSDHIIIEGSIPGYVGTFFNSPLAYRTLHYNFWRHGRYAISGEMNGATTAFISVAPQKQQEQLKIPMCLADFEAWDFSGLVKTQFGDGEIVTAEYSIKEEMLYIDLIF